MVRQKCALPAAAFAKGGSRALLSLICGTLVPLALLQTGQTKAAFGERFHQDTAELVASHMSK